MKDDNDFEYLEFEFILTSSLNLPGFVRSEALNTAAGGQTAGGQRAGWQKRLSCLVVVFCCHFCTDRVERERKYHSRATNQVAFFLLLYF